MGTIVLNGCMSVVILLCKIWWLQYVSKSVYTNINSSVHVLTILLLLYVSMKVILIFHYVTVILQGTNLARSTSKHNVIHIDELSNGSVIEGIPNSLHHGALFCCIRHNQWICMYCLVHSTIGLKCAFIATGWRPWTVSW